LLKFSAFKILIMKKGGKEMINREIKTRQAETKDLSQLLEIDREIWPESLATEEMFRSRLETFPEGQIVAVKNDQAIGSFFTELINFEDWAKKDFSWNEVTDEGSIRRTHNPKGDSMYGVGLAVSKKFQGIGVSQVLIAKAIKLIIQINRRQYLLGSRIPGYYKHTDIPVDVYIETRRGKSQRLMDPELAFYAKYGAEPVKVLPNYISDSASLDYGVLIRWKNPFYNKPFKNLFGWAFEKTVRCF
jgi:GNAT superfamily N-acetyltransferase